MLKVFVLVLAANIALRAQNPADERELIAIEDALQAGDSATASRLIASGLRQHGSRDGGLINLRGVLHAQQNELAAARQDFALAVKLSPDLVPAWQNLARACTLQAGKDAPAVPCAVDSWQHVLTRNPADTEALHSLTLLYERQGKTAEARQTLERLAILDSKNPAHLLELARLADGQKDYEGALGYLAHARDLSPGNPQIHFLYAKEAIDLNLVVEARRSLDRALAIEPRNPAYNFAQGFVLLRTREAATAAGYFEKFVAAEPGNAKGHYALGIAYFNAGDYGRCKVEMEKAKGNAGTAGGAEYFLGRIAISEDKLDEAAAHLRRSAELLPAYPESHTELARVLMLEGDLRAARRELDAALRLDPQSFGANERLLVLYRRTHDEHAEEQAERVKKLDADRSRRADLMLRTVEFRP